MKRRRVSDSSATPARPVASWRASLVSAALLWVARVDGREVAPVATHRGTGSAFYLSSIASASCSLMAWSSLAETHYAAVVGSNAQPRETSSCGRCARVWCDDPVLCSSSSAPTGNTSSALVFVVQDQCTNCGDLPNTNLNQSLNLAWPVLEKLTGSATIRSVGIRWQFDDCPAVQSGNEGNSNNNSNSSDAEGEVENMVVASVCVRRDSSAYWLALQPVNDTLGVQAIQVNGLRASLESTSYFYSVLAPSSERWFDLSRVNVTMNTRKGKRYSRTVALTPGLCVGIRSSDQVPVAIEESQSGSGSDVGEAGASDGSANDDNESIPSTHTSDSSSSSRSGPNAGFSSQGDDDVVTPRPPVPSPPATPPPPDQPSSSPSRPAITRSPRPSSSSSSSDSNSIPLRETPTATPPPGTADPIRTDSPSLTQPVPSTVITSPGPASTSSAPASKATNQPPSQAPTGPSVSTNSPSPPSTQTPAWTPPPWPDGDGLNDWTTAPPQSPTPTPSVNDTIHPSPRPTRGTGPSIDPSIQESTVLLSPVFIGLLLGFVFLVGAIVAYRAKTRQQHLLGRVPLTALATSAQSTSRAAYTSANTQSTRAQALGSL